MGRSEEDKLRDALRAEAIAKATKVDEEKGAAKIEARTKDKE